MDAPVPGAIFALENCNFIYHEKRVNANAFLSFYITSFRFRRVNKDFRFSDTGDPGKG
jgi:hypothetical protein